MQIFDAEKDIAQFIQANNSFAYDMKPITMADTINSLKSKEITWTFSAENTKDISVIKMGTLGDFVTDKDFDEIVTASIKDKELYYHTAILVTTNWNKNDDVFLPPVVWDAKDTPVHKPTNLGHDSTKIIGHMTGSWAINTDGEIIEQKEDMVELPSKFHILVGSVIYKVWPSNEEYEKNIEELITQIEAGDKYVSMECGFKHFDYALKSDAGVKIVSRNNDTAFLSKYLRAYGGEGYYKDYKIGRVVREISFCGKGYVDKPANPESVIFTKEEISDFSAAKFEEKLDENKNCGVVSNNEVILVTENKIMSDFYKEQNDELKSQNTALAKSLDEIKDKLAQSNVEKLEQNIVQLSAQVKDMSDVLNQKSDEVKAKATEVDTLNVKVADLTKANDELIKQNKDLVDQFAVIEAERKTSDRIATLVAGGFTKEDADAKVKVFAALDDAQFNLVATEIIEAKKFVKPEPKDDKEKDDKKKSENPGDAKAEDLENVEVVEEVTSAGVITDELDVAELAGKLSAEFKISKDGDK